MHRFSPFPLLILALTRGPDPTNQLIGYSLYLLGSIAPICQNIFNFTFNWDRRTMAQVYQKAMSMQRSSRSAGKD